MSETKHTPWNVDLDRDGVAVVIRDETGLGFCKMQHFIGPENWERAAFIVRAVNAHEDLVRIAESAVSLWGFMENNLSLDKDERLAASRMAVAGRAALARARE